MSNLIYKIVDEATWRKAESQGEFAGASIDLTDGYIHFSTDQQVQETADKHFVGQTGLLLVAVDTDVLEGDLRWEPSRGGDLFPHLYGKLNTQQVASVSAIQLDKNGKHIIDLA